MTPTNDGSQLVAETSDEGIPPSQYVWLNDKPVGLLKSGHLYAVHTDHRNAPLAVTDEARTVVWQAQVADYLLSSPVQGGQLGQVEFNLRGSNQYFDAESGLHYNTNRYFDPVAQRYLSPDPMGLAVGPDLYAFALNRPHSVSDPLGLAPAGNEDVSGWSFAKKLAETATLMASRLPGDLQSVLLDMVSPEKIATTAAIFALWAGSHAIGIGFAFDAVMLGVAYYTLGKAAADLVIGLIETTVAINNAKCRTDLDAAANKLSRALSKGAGAFIEGALLRKVFSKTEGDLGATAINKLKQGINYGKNKIVDAAPGLVKLGFRASAWAATVTNSERGFMGELDAWSILMAGKAKLRALCCKTLQPEGIQNQAAYEAELAAYRGTNGIDGAFESKPGFFKHLFGGKDQYYVVESKATADTFRYTIAELNGLLSKTKAGDQQLSSRWLGRGDSANSRLSKSVDSQAQKDAMQHAMDTGKLNRVLATTDKNGTRYWEVIQDPVNPGKVTVGREITSQFL